MILMGVLMFTGKMNDINGYPLSRSAGYQQQRRRRKRTIPMGMDRRSQRMGENAQTDDSKNANKESPAEEDRELVPAPLADLALTDQFGNTHSLSDYRGKVIFLNFWATWCGPCRRECRISRNSMKNIRPGGGGRSCDSGRRRTRDRAGEFRRGNLSFYGRKRIYLSGTHGYRRGDVRPVWHFRVSDYIYD